MRASCSYQLIDNQGGGYCIGADGDDFAELVRCLKDLYGSRLVRIVDDQTGEVLDLRISNPAESGNDAAVSGEPPGETGPRGTVRSGTVQPNHDIAPPKKPVPDIGCADEEGASIAKISNDALIPPKVLNKRTHGIPSGAVYIGRPGKWGNPFIIGKDGDREQVVAKYRNWILTQPELIAAARRELAGKNLVCYCAPEACHGDVLLELVNPPRGNTAEPADASRSTDPATQIITLLTAAGWQPAGCTQEEIIHSRNSGKPKFDEADRPITMGGRPRLRKGNRFVTVGARTTCFYRRTAGAPDGFRRIKTKDIAAVLAAAGEKPCTSIQPQN